MAVFLSGVDWRQQNAELVNQQIQFVDDPNAIRTEISASKIEYDTVVIIPEKDAFDNDLSVAIFVRLHNFGEIIVPLQLVANYPNGITITKEMMVDAESIVIAVSSPLPLNILFAAAIRIKTSNMFFNRSDLLQFISLQQLTQFEAMNPNIVQQSYQTTIGTINSQIGNYYDLKTMLEEQSEADKDQTLLWILKVFTAFNVCGSSMQISAPLEFNFKTANETLASLKGGQQSLTDGVIDKESSTVGKVVSMLNKYLG